MKKISIFLSLFSLSLLGAERPLYVGALEDFPAFSSTRIARVLFVKEGKDWVSMEKYIGSSHYPLEVTWFVVFDGKRLGGFQSQLPEGTKTHRGFESRETVHQPKLGSSLPTIGKPTMEFTGFESQKHLRPLVIISQKNYKDPDRWKPIVPDSEHLQRGIQKFREIVKLKLRDKNIPYEYQNQDIQVLKSYRSRSNQFLIHLRLDMSLQKRGDLVSAQDAPVDAEGDFSDDTWSDHWFFVEGETIKHLGASMQLVDAGDYDNDGISEVLFWSEGYDVDGYTIFYNRFEKSAGYFWSYH